jgi:hypothetical protein
MGMDFDLRSDKEGVIKTDEYVFGYLNQHGVSRTFCHLFDLEDFFEGEPELIQIARLAGVDILPILQMALYSKGELDFLLNKTEREDEEYRNDDTTANPKGNLEGNIDKVLRTLSELLEKLSQIENLPDLLVRYGYDTIDYDTYFTDFSIDKGDGYIGNNFGQDLRNLKSAVEYAKDKGATTVYFGFD